MIVFCTTCKGRAQHLEQTLPKNLADNPDDNCKFVVLDYGSIDHLTPYLKLHHHKAIKSGKLTVYHYPTAGAFHMAHAKNMAHRIGMLEGGDVLVNLDADNYTERGFADYVESTLQEKTEETFLYARWRTAPRIPKGCSGRIVVSRRAFLNAGGYDEKYDTWGPDDKDFSTRLRRLGYTSQEIDRRYLNAVLHTDKMRFREYPHVTPGDYTHCEPTLESSDVTIANYGNIGCGVVYKNFDFSKPIELKPLPTRVFGIGMHKTATTSLHVALRVLGLDSAHWQTAHWAKAIWREMTTGGRSNTVEQSYALSDLPIPILYKELDRAYPNSKFILTVRDEEKWLDSVRRHWSAEYNPYRHQWNDDYFTHKVHKLVYGQKGFDAELFVNRYRRHNDEVIKYFNHRRDLCVMHMDHGAGWSELCTFLDKPIPVGVEYPRVFSTQKPHTA